MLDALIGGIRHGSGHRNYRSGGYGFQEQKELVDHSGSEGGYFDHQARYEHHMRLPTNHGRPPMAHMPPCDEEDSDEEDIFESNQSHYATTLPHHSNIHYHNGTVGNGWQGHHEDAYHSGNGMQHHGGHGILPHAEHRMQHHDTHGMQHQGGHVMQHQSRHEMEQLGGHGMHHQVGHGMQHNGRHETKHQDRVMAPQFPPRHVYMNPIHSSNDGRAVVVKATENWRASNRKLGWGSKGL